MANDLILDKEVFVTKFLQPISKLADTVAIYPNEKGLYALCSSQDGSSVVLYAELRLPSLLKGILRLNLPDVKKFVRLIDCIEDKIIRLTLQDNHLVYDTNNIRFKYYLLEDSYIQKNSLNPEKIKNLKFDSTFKLPVNRFNEILKGSSIATDSEKVYFYSKDNQVYAELNDHERQNINSITYFVTNDFEGEPIKNSLPFNLESIRMLAGIKADHFVVKVNNTLKISLFEIEDENTSIKFIISALVK